MCRHSARRHVALTGVEVLHQHPHQDLHHHLLHRVVEHVKIPLVLVTTTAIRDIATTIKMYRLIARRLVVVVEEVAKTSLVLVITTGAKVIAIITRMSAHIASALVDCADPAA